MDKQFGILKPLNVASTVGSFPWIENVRWELLFENPLTKPITVEGPTILLWSELPASFWKNVVVTRTHGWPREEESWVRVRYGLPAIFGALKLRVTRQRRVNHRKTIVDWIFFEKPVKRDMVGLPRSHRVTSEEDLDYDRARRNFWYCATQVPSQPSRKCLQLINHPASNILVKLGQLL